MVFIHRLRDVGKQSLLLLVGFAALVVVGVTSIALDAKTQTDAEWVEHTLEMMNNVLDVRLSLRQAESTARGYVLTSDPQQFEEFHKVISNVLPAFARLKRASADNPGQQQLLTDVEPQVVRRLDVLRTVINPQTPEEKAAVQAISANREGRGLMEKIDRALDRFSAEERRLLAIRSATSKQTGLWLVGIDLVAVALILAMGGTSILLVRTSNRERAAAMRKVEATNVSLEKAVAERTEHLRLAHQELQQSASVMQTTVAGMTEAVLAVDLQGDVLLANEAAATILGYRPGVSIDQLTEGIVAFESDGVTLLPSNRKPLARALAGEQFDNLQVVIKRPDVARPVNIAASGRPLRNSSGEIQGAAVVYRDVTETLEIERQLRQSQKLDAIGQLTGGVAHDFNNMLTVILGTSEFLVEGLADRPDLLGVAKLIDQAAERGRELTKHLLAFARKQPLDPQDVDVNKLVLETAALLRPTLGEHIEVESMLEGELQQAHIDPSQLSTALLNLAVNARDAMPSGGKLTLETGNVVLDESYAQHNAEVQPGVYVMVAVSDTGGGIPPALRDKVFEPFFTTKEVGKGTGLGLSMVYGFVKQSGGHIKIYSEEGHGTTVKLYLPWAGESAQAQATAAPVTAGGHETILVVEDDELVRDFVVAQLHSLGYATVTALDGNAALAQVRSGVPFDLLFTDVIMPGGMNGRQLAEEIRKLRPGVRVLFTSGYTENAIVHHGRLDPGVLLLAKPYRKSDLARMVRSALEQLAA